MIAVRDHRRLLESVWTDWHSIDTLRPFDLSPPSPHEGGHMGVGQLPIGQVAWHIQLGDCERPFVKPSTRFGSVSSAPAAIAALTAFSASVAGGRTSATASGEG